MYLRSISLQKPIERIDCFCLLFDDPLSEVRQTLERIKLVDTPIFRIDENNPCLVGGVRAGNRQDDILH